jgi:hypothetical protein
LNAILSEIELEDGEEEEDEDDDDDDWIVCWPSKNNSTSSE